MAVEEVKIGYLPLIDAAPVILAHELGFDAAEGLKITAVPAASWARLRDMLANEEVQAAHMLATIPIAGALGLLPNAQDFDVITALSSNGNVLGISAALAQGLSEQGYGFDFCDAKAAGDQLAQLLHSTFGGSLTVGVPYAFSMHHELFRYWQRGTALEGVNIRYVALPPSHMSQALRSGEIDAFCVGEPWGSMAVENGSGALLLPSNAIWALAPEKTLCVRRDTRLKRSDLVGNLIRIFWAVGRWLDTGNHRSTAAQILSKESYLGLPQELLDRALSGALTINASGSQRQVDGFVHFGFGGAGFPWGSHARWIAQSLAQDHGLDSAWAMDHVNDTYRSQEYRAALAGIGAALPGASEKLEGSLESETLVASTQGQLILPRDEFFDRCIFDPRPSGCLNIKQIG